MKSTGGIYNCDQSFVLFMLLLTILPLVGCENGVLVWGGSGSGPWLSEDAFGTSDDETDTMDDLRVRSKII